MFKKIILSALSASTLLLVLLPSYGLAEPLTFSSGIEGGGYWSAATRLQAVAADLGLEVQVEASSGSLHNLERLFDTETPTSLILTQADALHHYLNENQGELPKFEILENIGQECVFIITDNNSTIHSDADLQQRRDYQIAISGPNSGAAVTYAYMTTLAPEMSATSVKYTDTGAAMAAMEATDDSAVNAVMVVHRPREYSPEVDLTLRNPDRFRFVKIADERLKGALPNGDAVYNSMDLAIPVPDSSERQRVTTACVKGLLVANKEKMSRQQRDILGRLVAEQWIKVYATER